MINLIILKEFLKDYKLLLPSQIYSENISAEDMITTINNLAMKAKNLNKTKFAQMKQLSKKDRSGLSGQECIHTITKYSKELGELSKALSAKRKYVKKVQPKTSDDGQQPTISTGDGLKRNRNYYTIKDGKFGNLKIDTHKLIGRKLEVHKGNKKIISKQIDRDLFDLLTRRIDKKENIRMVL
jgi:hypothetical protein